MSSNSMKHGLHRCLRFCQTQFMQCRYIKASRCLRQSPPPESRNIAHMYTSQVGDDNDIYSATDSTMLVQAAAKKYGIYGKYRFMECNSEMKRDELDLYTNKLINAIQNQDMDAVRRLGLATPGNPLQRSYVKDQILKSTSFISMYIELTQRQSYLIDELTTNFSSKLFSGVLEAFHSTGWMGVSVEPTLIKATDEFVLKNDSLLSDELWCKYLQWRVMICPMHDGICNLLFNDRIFRLNTLGSCVAVAALIPSMGEIKLSWVPMIGDWVSQTLLTYASMAYNDIDWVAILCRATIIKSHINHHQPHILSDQRAQALLWDTISHHVKHCKDELSLQLVTCIYAASLSHQRNGVLSKFLETAEIIVPKLCTVQGGQESALKVILSMFDERHISIAATDMFLEKAKTSDWTSQHPGKVAKLLSEMGNYGTIDTATFSSLLKHVLSERFTEVSITRPLVLLKAVSGLASFNVYPHTLYKKLLSKDYSLSLAKNLPGSAVKYLSELRFLDGNLAIMSPEYDGPRLSETKKVSSDNVREKRQNHRMVSKWGIKQSNIIREIIDAVNVMPEVSRTYIAQYKPALPHFMEADIVLTSMNKSKSDAVIQLLYPPDILQLYDSKQEHTKTRLGGIARLKKKSLEKLGYKVAMISLEEYKRSRNFKQLVFNKLKASGCIS